MVATATATTGAALPVNENAILEDEEEAKEDEEQCDEKDKHVVELEPEQDEVPAPKSTEQCDGQEQVMHKPAASQKPAAAGFSSVKKQQWKQQH